MKEKNMVIVKIFCNYGLLSQWPPEKEYNSSVGKVLDL